MSEEENTGVETMEMAPDAAGQEDGHLENQSAPSENAQEKNWRLMREQMDELKRYNQRLESEIYQIKAPKTPPQEEEVNFADDDLSTVAITKKLAKKEAQKIVQEIISKKDAEYAEQMARLKYQDYDAVVTNENLQRLVQTAPELAKMLMSSPDPVGAYKLLKTYGNDGQEVGMVKDNQTKPRSVNSVGQTSALSQAHTFARGLTSDVKKQLWSEMQEAIKAR